MWIQAFPRLNSNSIGLMLLCLENATTCQTIQGQQISLMTAQHNIGSISMQFTQGVIHVSIKTTRHEDGCITADSIADCTVGHNGETLY